MRHADTAQSVAHDPIRNSMLPNTLRSFEHFSQIDRYDYEY